MKRCLSPIYGPATTPRGSALEVRLAQHYHATHCDATPRWTNFAHVLCAPNLSTSFCLSKAMVVAAVTAPSLHQLSPEAMVVVVVVVSAPSLKTLA